MRNAPHHRAKNWENLQSPSGFCSSSMGQSLEAALTVVSVLPAQEDVFWEAGEMGMARLPAGELQAGQV